MEKQTVEQLAEKNWKKNWAGGWSLLSAAYLALHYTKHLKASIGIGLEEALFVSRKGITQCYFIDAHKNAFGEHFAAIAKNDPAIISTWAQGIIAAADHVVSLKHELVQLPATRESFVRFFDAMNEYGIYHRYVKMVVDFLPKDILGVYLDELAEGRVHAEPVYEEMEKYMHYFAAEVSSTANVAPELILSMTKDQFEEYLENGLVPDVEILTEQYQNTLLYVSATEEQYCIGVKDVGIFEDALMKGGEGKEIKGQVAFRGKVQGRVRVILDVSTPVEFLEGEILVTGMTRPDYLPYVKKSVGFVTDAGGILSHAAITARELEKPCVIGTEIATKVFKTGDMVEIDAENGIVRKIV